MRRLIYIAAFVVFTATAFAQRSARVREMENQRKAALNEIELTNRLLSETNESAKNSLNRLNLLTQRIGQRKRVVYLLNQEIALIDREIISLRDEISFLEKELNAKRINYGASVKKLQNHYTTQDKLLFIFSANNFTQSFRRMRYLKEYADWQRRQADEISVRQKTVKAKWDELEKTRNEKQILLHSREEETKILQDEEALQQKEINELNKRQKRLQDDLKKKQRQAEALQRQIEKQIAEEVAKVEAEARSTREQEEKIKDNAIAGSKNDANKRVAESKGGYAMTREEKRLSDNFASNRGRLPAPVTGQYSIVGTYGEQQHQDLKYVRVVNNGIDIQATAGSEARAVFDGKVSSVLVERGYNNWIIVRHGNYLTVYCNLSEIYVKRGDTVKARQSLGKIFTDSENDNATIFHFELWKEREKQNPQPWLSR
ncbi:MAG: peptidoglycan DD-metalloendopeptidase family protein [Tannerellaceae bacterium]|jgi:septal ring factor EnvC (AmiA/AmiB activator)|nr:peptidoglycan DD-metalloendopeptidase family protein [Tannerellaceae bacterium]